MNIKSPRWMHLLYSQNNELFMKLWNSPDLFYYFHYYYLSKKIINTNQNQWIFYGEGVQTLHILFLHQCDEAVGQEDA